MVTPSFEAILQQCFASGATPGARELAISQDDTRVRLERLVQEGEWYEGEVVRKQTDNIPPEAEVEGLKPSRAQSVGHSAAFRFNPALKLLVLEKNSSGMTLNRFLRYLKTFNPSARYTANPIANEDVWERFGRMKPKRFSVTLASVTNPEAVEGAVGAVLSSGKRLKEALNAPTIHISVREGGLPDGMNKGAVSQIISGLLDHNNEGYQVTSLSVQGEDEEEDGGEVLNFLDDILKDVGEVPLNDLTVDQAFEARIVFLRACYAQHVDYITSYYGTA